MANPPSNYTWLADEIPSSANMNARLYDVATFLMNPPMVRLRKTTTQNILNSTVTPVSWDLVEIEQTNMWSSTLPTRLQPSVPGWYFGNAGISFFNNATGYREMDVRKNNSGTDRVLRTKCDAWTDSVQTVTTRGHTFLEQFNGTTDYIEVTAWQNSGVTLSLYVDVMERQPDVSLRWIAAL